MDISEKQAKWRQERPLFEAELIHSHLLPFFNFNENTGDYEIKVESVANTDDEDRKVAYESLNTGWVMWLRAKSNAKASAVPYESCSIKSHEIIINETKSELIDGYDIAKEDEYLLESLVYRGVCIGVAVTTPHLPEWISISDHIPEEGQEVLVHHLGQIEQVTKDKKWQGGFKRRNCYGWETAYGSVSHWLPRSIELPKSHHFYYENDAKRAQEDLTINTQEQSHD
jgi:hypothetical protein